MKKMIVLFLGFIVLSVSAQAQKGSEMLQSGPMLGHADMLEVVVWVQTKASADVYLTYWEDKMPSKVFRTDTYTTQKESAFTAHLTADRVLPGKSYTYKVMINSEEAKRPYPLKFKTQKLWQFREDPPEFTIAVGSCAFINEERFDRPGKGYGNNYQIFESIAEDKPDMMLWLGDNVYFREPDYTLTGMHHRYTHARSLPEMQKLLAVANHYAIWDDHDYGPNDSDRSFIGKKMSEQVFKRFWANPHYNATGEGGITSRFTYNDVEFFLLDDRYFRSPNRRKTGERQILGEKQIEWLIDALASSHAPFKLVLCGGQIINPANLFENLATRPEERTSLLKKIREAEIPGVFFLSGDRHHSVLMKLEEENHYPFYELTCSPLTSGSHPPRDSEKEIQVEGTEYVGQNYALIKVSGARKERVLTIRLLDAEGKEIWKQEIKAEELRKK